MKISINLPTVVSFSDYHEIPWFQDELRKIIPGVKVSEIGATHEYHAIVYLGRKSEPSVQALIKNVEKQIREYEAEEEL